LMASSTSWRRPSSTPTCSRARTRTVNWRGVPMRIGDCSGRRNPLKVLCVGLFGPSQAFDLPSGGGVNLNRLFTAATRDGLRFGEQIPPDCHEASAGRPFADNSKGASEAPACNRRQGLAPFRQPVAH
jgi:hypothetical protein